MTRAEMTSEIEKLSKFPFDFTDYTDGDLWELLSDLKANAAEKFDRFVDFDPHQVTRD